MWISENMKNLIFLCNGVYYKIICTNFVVKGIKNNYRFSMIKNEK